MEATNILNTIKGWITAVGIKIVISIIILVFGFKLINLLSKKLSNLLNERVKKIDRTIMRTCEYVLTILLKIILVSTMVSYLGIETSSISAVIASAGIGVGLSVNGTLSNLSGGIMLLVTRPFSIGDYIQAQGQEGTVQDIHISYTRILTNDKKNVYLPNSALSSGIIVNYSSESIRRVNFDFVIGVYEPEKIRSILMRCMEKNPLILKDPKPEARVCDFGEGKGTKLFTTAYCKSADYWDTYYSLLEDVNAAYRENDIQLPMQRMEVHVKQD